MSRFFNKYYDTWMEPIEKRAFHSIRKRLLLQAKGTVLEIGSGTGVNFKYYQHVDKVVGVEPELSMLEKSLVRVNQSDLNIEVIRASAEQLPFHSDTFDSVVGTLVFCTIPDPVVALKEIRRVCKPGGKVLLFEHVRLSHPIWGTLQDWLTPTWRKLCSGCHLNRNTLDAVEQAGFQVTHIEWKYKKLFVVVEAVNAKH
jgi:ubiquinone/menaquinone biosynthesis C-methylase UbiE